VSAEYDIAVAGGGIAGLTGALTAARLGRRTLVLTGDVIGGNLLSIERVEAYPGFAEGIAGFELCPMTQEQAAEAGALFEALSVRSIDGDATGYRLSTDAGEYSARAVLIASGCEMKTLGVPGEERLKGHGVSHCASCDGPMLRGATVAVIGGGDSALQEALTLAQHVDKIIVLAREALTAQLLYRDRVAAEPRIEVRTGVQVEEIVGDDVVTGVRTSAGIVEASAAFVYIGLSPVTAFTAGRLALDADGRIVTDASMATSLPGVFAAGSVRSGWAGRAVASAGDGATAALAAHRYLG
jgi:thioredoxin reductase (NADPH)